jgi:hypothetical protein
LTPEKQESPAVKRLIQNNHKEDRGNILVRCLWACRTDCIINIRITDVDTKSQRFKDPHNQRNHLDNHISHQLADNGLVDSSMMLDIEDRQDIMLDTDKSFAFQEDEVIMDASTNVFVADDEDDSLQFTDRLRSQHTSEIIMSLKLLMLLRLTGAPHYAYRSIMDIFADALASKVVTAGATFC